MAETGAVDERARRGSARLVVVCGLPGVGKSTVARTIAERVDGELLRTDVVRKELFADPGYTAEETRRVYRELLRRGRETVERGGRAVLDGTFRERTQRERARKLSETLAVEFSLVKVECPPDVVEDRLRRREGDPSDADFEVYAMLRERFEPVAMEHVTVDNSGDVEATREQVADHF